MDYRYLPFYMQGNAITGIYYGQWGMSEDRDIDYVKEMYPMTFSKMQAVIEQECDRQEFAGSMMFDEYPDKLGLWQIVNRVFNKIKEDEKECKEGDKCTKYPDDQWLKDIIMVLLLNEMYRRRRGKRYY